MYVAGDVTVSVTSKPKNYYIHLLQQIGLIIQICIRLLYREEHESPNNFAGENSEEFSEPGEAVIYMNFISWLFGTVRSHDTSDELQACITKGHAHKKREELTL